MRYLILASPRSGSTLVGRMLHATGQAGDPLEYFNPNLRDAERDTRGLESLSFPQYLSIAEARSTTANGVFGMHLHLSQFADAFHRKPGERGVNGEMLAFLRSFDKFIWTRRRNRIRQAVSWVIAKRAKSFHSRESAEQINEYDIMPDELVNALSLVCANDFGWENLIKRNDLRARTVWYEDMVTDYHGSSRIILRHLGLNGTVRDIPPPPIQKQATELNDRLARRFAGYLGISTGEV